MRTFDQLYLRMKRYIFGVDYVYDKNVGYIVWQYSSGENVEILFIEAKDPGNGQGKELVRRMLHQIKPYHSVFVIRRAINDEAGKFYRSLGFTETVIKGLYKDEDAVFGVASYEQLLKTYEITS